MSLQNTTSQPFFRCKTDNAFRIKIMTEIISNVLKTSFWEIGPGGISLSMFDDSRKTMITVMLNADEFQYYTYNGNETIHIGINSSHLHKMLKSIKKKDNIELQIDTESSNDLKITTIPREQNRTTVSYIKIQTVQNLEVVNPTGYGHSIIIPSTDFQKMIKDLHTLNSEKIIIKTANGIIDFTADADGIMKRTVSFGEYNDTYKGVTSDFFSTEQIQRISKIAALYETIHVYPSSNVLPIQFKTKIGTLGEMSIFIKSDENISRENE
jgi:hypothetical protein